MNDLRGRNDCTLDIGIVNVRKMELIRDGDFLNDDLRDPRSISPLKIRSAPIHHQPIRGNFGGLLGRGARYTEQPIT